MNKIRPFLKWAGGKYSSLDKIIPFMPKGSRLIEPFTGSGVVFLNTDFQNYLIAEYNKDLVELYGTLKAEGSSFIDFCSEYFKHELNVAEQYYSLRSQFNQSSHSRERAALFLYLNRHGFNGLCRYNLKGQYNVPFGLFRKPYFPRQEMEVFHQKSQQAEFIHADFRKTFALAQPGDVIYCDPPYVPLSKTADFTSYTHRHFSLDDQAELAHLAKQSASNGIYVLISNHDTEFTRKHYTSCNYMTFEVRRTISCNGLQRNLVKEVLAVFKP